MSEHHDEPTADEALTGDELALLAGLDALLADPAMWGRPSDEVEDDVLRAIGEARRTAVAEPPPPSVAVEATAGAPAAAPAPAPVTDLAGRRSRRSRAWSLVGAAAVGAAAAGLIVGLVAKRDDSASSNADHAPAGATTQQLTLTGTDLAPGISGTATVTPHPSGVEIRLDVPGLPNRSGGEFYQAWVKTCDGSLLVPAGSFHDLTDAIGWVGVSMDEYPIVTVTQEVAVAGQDPAQGSSGKIVVGGTLGTCPSS
ncbi:MAG: anti-sigma factor [Ilumatobacteraceae bacterium]